MVLGLVFMLVFGVILKKSFSGLMVLRIFLLLNLSYVMLFFKRYMLLDIKILVFIMNKV